MADMREKLAELIRKANTAMWGKTIPDRQAESRFIADYLIENGIILPPCKVGDTVYVRNRANKPQAMKFDSVDLRCTCEHDDECMCGSLCNDKGHNICQYRFKNDFSDIGKTVFLTKEEAQKVITGRSKENDN